MKLYARKTGSGQGVIADEEGAGKTIAVTYNEEDAFMLAHRAMVHDELVEALEESIDACSEVCGCGECGGCKMADRHFKVLLKAKANQNNR